MWRHVDFEVSTNQWRSWRFLLTGQTLILLPHSTTKPNTLPTPQRREKGVSRHKNRKNKTIPTWYAPTWYALKKEKQNYLNWYALLQTQKFSLCRVLLWPSDPQLSKVVTTNGSVSGLPAPEELSHLIVTVRGNLFSIPGCIPHSIKVK